MFNTYYTTEEVRREYITKEINIHRAPTDESIKLLNEVQEKAISNIIKQIPVANNLFSATILVYQNNYSQCLEVHCKFTLNGKEHIIKTEIDGFHCPTMEDAIKDIYEKICKELTYNIMCSFKQDLFKHF